MDIGHGGRYALGSGHAEMTRWGGIHQTEPPINYPG